MKGRTTQAYGLSYDYLDRLSSATSSEYNASNSIVNSGYFNESQNFDVRGNITSQLRSGLVKASSGYTVKANLDAPTLGVVSGTNQTTTATGVSSIPAVNVPLSVPHNFLNLPTSFSFNGGNRIDVLYDGLGNKLRKTVTTAGSVSLTQDYLGGIELKNGVVEAVYNEEGRAYNTGGSYRYEYVLRDHLGNTRLVFTDKDGSGSIDNSEILSETHYYPFGRKMDGAWYSDASAGPYRYLYNGKELSEEFDLNFYDYGARWYDPGLGSWWEIDPLAEVSRRWSPYVFSDNNPLRFIDPDGRQVIKDFNGNEHEIGENDVKTLYQAKPDDLDNPDQTSASGDPPIKGGGFPKGEIRSTVEQNAVLRSKDFGWWFTREERAMQTGVEIGGALEGSYGLLTLSKSILKLFKSADDLAALGKVFNPIHPGPLDINVANTFRSGTYAEKVAEKDIMLYRYWGGRAREFGPFWSPAPKGPLASRMDGAVLHEWGNSFENLTIIRVPKGTTYYEGIAAPQTGKTSLLGGGTQMFIPTINAAWKIR